MPSENVKVAVRVRGFNDREREMNTTRTVEMAGNQVIIKAPPSELKDPGEKMFAFDYAYWSFDEFKVEEDGYLAPDGSGSRYCDQKKIFNDLGHGILENAFNGYNSSIFAYGQTGSGKSYSIIGYGANRGLVPQVCEKIFEDIKVKQVENPDNQYEVTFSMIEIYNEIIRDLLSSKPMDRKGIPIHEKAGRGFHILEKDLKPTSVLNYANIQKLMEKGNANKTIAETKMNATSSRAHTIVELVFKQTYKNDAGNVMQRMSVINLIDLAGSERSDKTGATGDRLKEGVAINLSLTCLGNVIAALASGAARVPYRESTLTKLLMNALGGNSKTIMIAAISPSDYNYAESVSTLRYADRAKQIKCNAVVNEDPKDKIIRQLQEEINKLKGMVKGGTIGQDISAELSQKEYEKAKKEMEENVKRQIEQNEKDMESLKKTYEQKLAEALAKSKELDKNNVNEKAKVCPHLSNINIDPMLTGSLKHLIEFPNNKNMKLIIGASDKSDIVVHGLGVQDKHAAISFHDNDFYLEPFANARVIRNGRQYEEKFQLNNFDRLVFGASLYYLFINPHKFGDEKETADAINAQISAVTVDKIQQEIAEETGLISSSGDRRLPDEIACINELIDLMPSIEEANQMSIILDKKMKYEPIILNPIVIGDPHSKARPAIIVKKFGTSNEWLWDSQKFIDRRSLMSEVYLDFKEDGKIDANKYKTFDPFTDQESEPILIGTGVVEPKCILHRIPLNENPKFFDYRRKLIGSAHVELVPCDAQGITYENIQSVIVRNPESDLKELHFLIRINDIKCLAAKYKKLYCEYKFFGEENFTRTDIGADTNTPNIKFQKQISFNPVDVNFIRYYYTYPLFVQLYGIQTSPSDTSKKLSTKDWFEKDKKDKNNSIEGNKEEMAKLQSELDKAKTKLKNLETLLDFAEKKKKKKIRIDYVRECILSNKPDVLTKLYEEINKSKDND